MPEYLTIDRLSLKDITRIFAKIKVDPVTGCWNWTGAPNTYGYGQIEYEGHYELVHRILYAWTVEPLQRGSGKTIPQLDHVVCDNRACCNPAHVVLTSLKKNILRGNCVSAVNARKTHCVNGHLLPNEPNRKPERLRPHITGRFCRTCSALGSRRAYLKRLPEGAHKEQIKQYYAEHPIAELVS